MTSLQLGNGNNLSNKHAQSKVNILIEILGTISVIYSKVCGIQLYIVKP